MSTLSQSYRGGRTSTRPQSILLVDSDLPSGESLSRLLRIIYGPLLRIDQAQSGHQAFQFLRNSTIDLVLIEYRLGDADGLEVMSQILDCVDQTAVLLMTDQPSDRLAAEALRQGAADYFVKNDLGPAELEQLITQALRTVRLEHRHRRAIEQWRLEQTERSDQVRALSDDMNIHMARLQRWMRHAGHASADTTLADSSLRQIGSELRQLQRLVADLSNLAKGSGSTFNGLAIAPNERH